MMNQVPKKRTKITHAGSVTYRQDSDGSETRYIIISSSNGEHWVLPKGHIESTESPEEAALRELREEAGILGEIKEKLSIQNFEAPGGIVAVQYFLIKEQGSCRAVEKRRIRWETLNVALGLLSFENTKAILLEGSLRVEGR